MKWTKEAFLEGQILMVDKPYGWSSFQAVNSIKWTLRKAFDLKKIKVGHAGTLDPLATGLLLVCTGKKTKTIASLQQLPKEYTGTICLGATRPSFDRETEIDREFPFEHIRPEDIEEVRQAFLGEITQKPPLFSAIKKDGKRLYQYARQGKETEIPERQVQIHEFEITAVNLPEVAFRIVCSKGTYIRSLASDFGTALKSGAYLGSLRRTKTGEFNVNNGQTPDQIREKLLPV